MRETPTIAETSYGASTSAVNLNNLGFMGAQLSDLNRAYRQHQLGDTIIARDWADQIQPVPAHQPKPIQPQKEIKPVATNIRRLVQVFIADPDENVPLDKCLIHKGEQQLTDLTDQELFYEIELKDALAKHNELRVTLINKKLKERTENLEPARIRDLKMTVVTIAQF